jgi:hypothetical protein
VTERDACFHGVEMIAVEARIWSVRVGANPLAAKVLVN